MPTVVCESSMPPCCGAREHPSQSRDVPPPEDVRTQSLVAPPEVVGFQCTASGALLTGVSCPRMENMLGEGEPATGDGLDGERTQSQTPA
mmetsp:Transcript_26918/g.70783  ORF Transcript_26918/g.70783 Transcript_26918/m.70783 type:complete len:90 (-) Transcript_26918:4141-4410(-)